MIAKTNARLNRNGLIGAALAVAAVLLPVTGCELSGEYDDDNVHVEFGHTNGTAEAEAP